MEIIFAPIAIFVWQPERAMLVAAVFALMLVIARSHTLLKKNVPTFPVLLALIMWLSFGILEYYAKRGGWNIRVDLLFFGPVIMLTTIFAVVKYSRGLIKTFKDISRDSETHPHGHISSPSAWIDRTRLRRKLLSLYGEMSGMRNVTLLILISFLLVGFYYLGEKAGQLPVNIHVLDNNGSYLMKWRRDWRSAPTKVISATVVGDGPDKLYVYIDTVYTGEQGRATTCGNIDGKYSKGVWSCSPTAIRERRGFTMLRFGLTSSARSIECSDSITVTMYDQNGHTFHRETFPYKKVWVKNPKGVLGKLREVFSSCPS